MPALDFLSFIQERQNITRLKNSGAPRPWTNDIVLHQTRLTNLNRALDRGTIMLVGKVQPLVVQPKVDIIVLYRTGYSAPKLLQVLQGNRAHDTSWLQNNTSKFASRLPYQVRLHRGQTIEDFMLKACFGVSDFNQVNLPSLNSATIEYAAEQIANSFKTSYGPGGYAMKFLGTEIAKDLTYFYPQNIDPNSMCPFNKGAIEGIQLLYQKKHLPSNCYSISNRIQFLQNQTSFNYDMLEHSLCEYNKYVTRWDYYTAHLKFPKQWLYPENLA